MTASKTPILLSTLRPTTNLQPQISRQVPCASRETGKQHPFDGGFDPPQRERINRDAALHLPV
jgi:hypothetical protein